MNGMLSSSRRGSFRRALTVFAAAAALAGASAPAALAQDGPVASFDFVADEGASPVGGRSGHWVTTPDSAVRVWEYQNVLKVDAESAGGFDFIRVELTDVDAALLQPGVHPVAPTPDAARMLVVSGSTGCQDNYGQFAVDRIERNADGVLVALDARFDQHCGSLSAPALRGEIHFRA